ncbi:MAG TPA: undecaprenyldiphospho-muramoylpentapeptide beta-N-acetylglucosaminyltransferase, partial [Coriobacteriia bacterium]|nr:undecaprenyldiphospho-muramoylpentapeptide beta-N-acetylglucosaminyltransferase [Coriobacteriia bacterium]
MRFVITGGGTAGHINPALAVAQELGSLGHEVRYAGKPGSLEARLVPEQGLEFVEFETAGFNRRKPWTLATSTIKIAASSRKARKWLKAYKPDAVIGFGGYVSIPVGLAASQENIPLIVHEQNSASGMANRFLAKRAQLVALSYAAAENDFKTRGEVVVTGNPVRAELHDIDTKVAREFFDIPAEAVVLLAFGGSLGARHINERLIA